MTSKCCPFPKTLGALFVAALISLLPIHGGTGDRPSLGGPKRGGPVVYGYRVVNVYPHDRQAYTQGLVFADGFLYESTGLNGASGVRRVHLETGRVADRYSLDEQHFGEGVTDWGDSLVQLTWRSNKGFIYDRLSLKLRGTFHYRGEGWGLTHDRRRLIMSDGTSTLRFLDPGTFREIGGLPVLDGDVPLNDLNELEYVRGEIFANVYRTDRIARISPRTGRVTGWIDLAGLLPEAEKRVPVDVLNGIAYDERRNRFFVTGKLWPKLFEIEVSKK